MRKFLVPLTFTKSKSTRYKACIGRTNNGRDERTMLITVEAPTVEAATANSAAVYILPMRG